MKFGTMYLQFSKILFSTVVKENSSSCGKNPWSLLRPWVVYVLQVPKRIYFVLNKISQIILDYLTWFPRGFFVRHSSVHPGFPPFVSYASKHVYSQMCVVCIAYKIYFHFPAEMNETSCGGEVHVQSVWNPVSPVYIIPVTWIELFNLVKRRDWIVRATSWYLEVCRKVSENVESSLQDEEW